MANGETQQRPGRPAALKHLCLCSVPPLYRATLADWPQCEHDVIEHGMPSRIGLPSIEAAAIKRAASLPAAATVGSRDIPLVDPEDISVGAESACRELRARLPRAPGRGHAGVPLDKSVESECATARGPVAFSTAPRPADEGSRRSDIEFSDRWWFSIFFFFFFFFFVENAECMTSQ